MYKTMKSVILSHKELQLQMFFAFATGFTTQKMPKGYFLTFSTDASDGAEFSFEFWKSASAPENGDGKLLFRTTINKGEHELNDVRLGVMTGYLRDRAYRFLAAVKEQFPEIFNSEGFSVQKSNVNPIGTELNVYQDKAGTKWATWLSADFNTDPIERTCLVEGVSPAESSHAFVKKLEQHIKQGTLAVVVKE